MCNGINREVAGAHCTLQSPSLIPLPTPRPCVCVWCCVFACACDVCRGYGRLDTVTRHRHRPRRGGGPEELDTGASLMADKARAAEPATSVTRTRHTQTVTKITERPHLLSKQEQQRQQAKRNNLCAFALCISMLTLEADALAGGRGDRGSAEGRADRAARPSPTACSAAAASCGKAGQGMASQVGPA